MANAYKICIFYEIGLTLVLVDLLAAANFTSLEAIEMRGYTSKVQIAVLNR